MVASGSDRVRAGRTCSARRPPPARPTGPARLRLPRTARPAPERAGPASRDQATAAPMRPAAAATGRIWTSPTPRNARKPSPTMRTRDQSDRVEAPRPLEAEPGRDRDGPRRHVPLQVGSGIRDGEGRAGQHRHRNEGDEEGRENARGPQPAVHRQQRDAQRERQPRPGRPLGDEIVAVADEPARRPRAPRPGHRPASRARSRGPRP